MKRQATVQHQLKCGANMAERCQARYMLGRLAMPAADRTNVLCGYRELPPLQTNRRLSGQRANHCSRNAWDHACSVGGVRYRSTSDAMCGLAGAALFRSLRPKRSKHCMPPSPRYSEEKGQGMRSRRIGRSQPERCQALFYDRTIGQCRPLTELTSCVLQRIAPLRPIDACPGRGRTFAVGTTADHACTVGGVRYRSTSNALCGFAGAAPPVTSSNPLKKFASSPSPRYSEEKGQGDEEPSGLDVASPNGARHCSMIGRLDNAGH